MGIIFVLVLLFKAIYCKNYTTRIIGGQETTIEKFPYQVMVLCAVNFEVTLCGGALINKKTILTAAHCVYNCKKGHLIVIAGSSEINPRYQHEVNSVKIHRDYEDGDPSNDIAIVCLKYALQYSSRIQPISITDRRYPEGKSAVVTGWGRINNNQVSKRLRYAIVRLISNQHCEMINPFIDDTQLCTSASGSGPCTGDSGGPLVTDKKLIGLVSYGASDCYAKMVRMYTDVYHFRSLIEAHQC